MPRARLHHLGFVGRDMRALQRRFLQEGAVAVSEVVSDPLQRVQVQFLREPGLGPDSDGMVDLHPGGPMLWELVAPLLDPGPAAPQGGERMLDSPLRSRLGRGGGLDHVCYELDDKEEDATLEAVLQQERMQGSQVVCEPVWSAALQRRIAFVFRRSGRLVEWVEPRPEGALF